MNTENPLMLAVLSILKNTNESISLYELMKQLECSGYSLVENDNTVNNELLMFRKNFVVMNALYKIQKDIKSSGYYLLVSSLKIELIPVLTLGRGSFPDKYHEDIETDAALSEYYLNWKNYNIDQQGVDELLAGFWKQYTEHSKRLNNYDKRVDALQVLGLDSNASWEDTQQAYRKLIIIYHPDKGGNSIQFIKIREAFLIIKLTQK